ncbi:hypothetical protein ACFZB9_05360 [Kitasatospora sp. NPDC008050]|uniref:hypothetical protein n=1 Tax=Kitasatospora sp. NPDC008050 TaxID=3364021 RepID=UPI0036DFF18A
MSLKIVLPATELRRRCAYTEVRAITGDPRYEDGAVVPAGTWQPIATGLCRRLQPDAQTPDSILVEPVSVADLGRSSFEEPHVTQLGRANCPADALTTTTNNLDGLRIGVHLDNWDKLAYAEKDRGRRRLCVNLGPGNRYLLVCDVDIQAICRAVRADYATCYPHTDDLRAYVAAGLPLKCIRIRLAPGEGYLAPTEYLPHDGSTQGCSEPSTAAFWLGRWPRGTFAPSR